MPLPPHASPLLQCGSPMSHRSCQKSSFWVGSPQSSASFRTATCSMLCPWHAGGLPTPWACPRLQGASALCLEHLLPFCTIWRAVFSLYVFHCLLSQLLHNNFYIPFLIYVFPEMPTHGYGAQQHPVVGPSEHNAAPASPHRGALQHLLPAPQHRFSIKQVSSM